MKSIKPDAWLALCVIAGALVYLYSDLRMPVAHIGDALGPRAFPALIGCALVLAGVLLLVETRNKSRLAAAAPSSDSALQAEAELGQASEAAPGVTVNPHQGRHQAIVLLAMVAWTGIYYTCFERVGYLVSTIVFLGTLLSYFHRRHYLTNFLVAVGFALIVDFLFSHLLNVPLPAGILSI